MDAKMFVVEIGELFVGPTELITLIKYEQVQ